MKNFDDFINCIDKDIVVRAKHRLKQQTGKNPNEFKNDLPVSQMIMIEVLREYHNWLHRYDENS